MDIASVDFDITVGSNVAFNVATPNVHAVVGLDPVTPWFTFKTSYDECNSHFLAWSMTAIWPMLLYRQSYVPIARMLLNLQFCTNTITAG